MLSFDLAVLELFWSREMRDWTLQDIAEIWVRKLARVED